MSELRKLFGITVCLALVVSLTACGGEADDELELAPVSESRSTDSEKNSYDDKAEEAEEESVPAPTGAIPINDVTKEQLMSYGIKGVGDATAAGIIEYREENGPFTSWADLDAAPRVGDAMLEKFRDVGVDFGDHAAAAASEEEAVVEGEEDRSDEKSSSTSTTSSTSSSGKININSATASQLTEIKGIGPSTAQKIIDYREENGSFKTVEDLTNVSGIGEKTLEKMRDQITI